MSNQAAKIKDALLKKCRGRAKEANLLSKLDYLHSSKAPAWVRTLFSAQRGAKVIPGSPMLGSILGGLSTKGGIIDKALLRNIAKQKRLEESLTGGLGVVGAGMGGLGSYELAHAITPGHFTAKALLDTTPVLAGGAALGLLGAGTVGKNLGKGINFIRDPKTFRARNALNESLSALTKTSSLSRAAKGAIAAPIAALALGPIAAATHMPGVVDDMIAHLGTKGGTLESIPSFLKPAYGPLRIPYSLGITKEVLPLEASQVAGASLAGLSALGAGAGKLSEKLIPIAKKSKDIAKVTRAPMSLMDKFKASSPEQKALVAAALFPWTLAAGAGAYALSNSDS